MGSRIEISNIRKLKFFKRFVTLIAYGYLPGGWKVHVVYDLGTGRRPVWRAPEPGGQGEVGDGAREEGVVAVLLRYQPV